VCEDDCCVHSLPQHLSCRIPVRNANRYCPNHACKQIHQGKMIASDCNSVFFRKTKQWLLRRGSHAATAAPGRDVLERVSVCKQLPVSPSRKSQNITSHASYTSLHQATTSNLIPSHHNYAAPEKSSVPCSCLSGLWEQDCEARLGVTAKYCSACFASRKGLVPAHICKAATVLIVVLTQQL
jgi:hypothetical protein